MRSGRRQPASEGSARVFIAVWLILAVCFLAAAVWVTWLEAHRVTRTGAVTNVGLKNNNGADAFAIRFYTRSGLEVTATTETKPFTREGVSISLGARIDIAYQESDPELIYVPGKHVGIPMLAVASSLLLFGIAFTWFDRTGGGPIGLVFNRRTPDQPRRNAVDGGSGNPPSK